LSATLPSNSANEKLILTELKTAIQNRSEEYSSDKDSSYQKKTSAITDLMNTALESNDASVLLDLSRISQIENFDISLKAAQKSEKLKDSPDANLAIAEAFQYLAVFGSGEEQKENYKQSAEYAEKAIHFAKQPTVNYYTTLAWSREQQGNNNEALALYTKALKAPKDEWSV
jgi:tetratricopeptide (TPR) repeat protein